MERTNRIPPPPKNPATAAGFADELARMVVDAYTRRMGEHATAHAEMVAVCDLLGCDEGDAPRGVKAVLAEAEAARADADAAAGRAGHWKARAEAAQADALTDAQWCAMLKATGAATREDALRRIDHIARAVGEKNAVLSAIAGAGLKAAQAVGVERVEDIPQAWRNLVAENERLGLRLVRLEGSDDE